MSKHGGMEVRIQKVQMAARFAVLLVGSAVLGPGASAAEPASPPQVAARSEIPASAFAGQSEFDSATLSPDGKTLAIRMTIGGATRIVLLDPVTKALRHQVTLGEDQELEWYQWFGNDRILLSVSANASIFDVETRMSRLLCFDYPSSTLNFIGRKGEGPDGDNVIYTDPDGRYLLLSLQRTIFDWPSVWRYDPVPGQPALSRVIQGQKPGIWGWVADDAGNVRMGFSTEFERLKIWYRKTPEDNLKVIARISEDDVEDKVWDVVRIVAGSDEGYVLEPVDGRVALRRFNYATRTSGEVIYRDPDHDLTRATIGENGEPSAVYYVDDKQRVVWLDKARGAVQAKLERAMPGMDVWPMSRARDESRMLVHVSREDDPGALYIYSAADRSLAFFANFRPALVTAKLARPEPVSYKARDGTAIKAYLTLPVGTPGKGLPLIVLPHGGPYGVRDTLTYDDEVQFLANRGYAVLQPNYRGSDGYGEDFEKLGKGQIGRAMQDDLDDATDWAVQQGIADPARVCVVGASYGGYAALWAAIRNPERYRCAASFAGVTDWNRQLRYDNAFFSRSGAREWKAWTRGDEKTFDFDSVSPARQVGKLKRPVLLAHGAKDSNVPFSQFNDLKNSAKEAGIPIETLSFPEAGHGFSRPEDEQRWYETLGAFLQRHNPAQ